MRRRLPLRPVEIGQHIIDLEDDTLLKILEMNPRPVSELSDELVVRVDPEDVVILPD